MKTEYEATFWPVRFDEVRAKLLEIGANKVYDERLMRRVVFYLPSSSPLSGQVAWARVRDEGDKVTMSVKSLGSSGAIEDQQETELEVSDYETGVEMLRLLGCEEKAYQETKRELWELDECAITLDTWPHLEPFVEVEGPSELAVRNVAEKLGFIWSEALFCSTDIIYVKRYGITKGYINDNVPRLIFDSSNPFISESV